MEKSKIVQLESISHAYRTEPTVRNVSISMESGESVVIFGADDEGKTTLLHILMGFETKYDGQARLFGCRPDRPDAAGRNRVRFVPDNIIWEQGVTAEEYLKFVRKASAAYDMDMQKALCEKYQMDVREYLLDMTYQDNKMVQIIGAVCAKPELLVLDEPTNFLGSKRCVQLREDMRAWNQSGMSLLIAAEQYEEARGCCNRYIYLRDGQVYAEGTLPQEDYRCKVVTVVGGRTAYLDGQMDQCIMKHGDRASYLYKGRHLPDILQQADCSDWVVEELSLAEELSEDYSRWEI